MEKIITEKAPIPGPDFSENSQLIDFSELDKHLKEGWKVKQLFHQVYGVNGVAKPSHIILTAHLEKLD